MSTYALTSIFFDNISKTFAKKTTQKQLGPHDALIKTTHSGICFTDVHAKDKGCGLGHEGVGFVKEIGATVSSLRVGDRVGWGWLHSSCGFCKTCVSGYRQYCSLASGFAFSDQDQGAFGDYRVIDADFAYQIPESISSFHAGPFMCAGASVFEALDAAGTKPGHRVGVVGVGGLGHMAILFARAMGCVVTAISQGSGKKNDALALGADEYHAAQELATATRSNTLRVGIDVLLITSNAVPELELLLPLLARRATIVLMTIQQEPLSIPYMPFVLPGHRLISSTEASRENHIRMLEFAARHKLKPWIEAFPMSAEGVAEAFEKLEQGGMRYRGVLVVEG